MTILGAIRAVADAPRSGDGPVDWNGAAAASKATVSPGSIELTPAEREGYATDIREARDRVREVTGLGFDLPETVEVQHRHHWIDANIATFRRVMEPLAELETDAFGIARTTNTGSMAVMLSFLGNNVLGQYDPSCWRTAPSRARPATGTATTTRSTSSTPTSSAWPRRWRSSRSGSAAGSPSTR
jgi:Uncharacterized conserved protein